MVMKGMKKKGGNPEDGNNGGGPATEYQATRPGAERDNGGLGVGRRCRFAVGLRFGLAAVDDPLEEDVGASLVLRIGRQVFVPGVGDHPAQLVIVPGMQQKRKELVFFLRGTGLVHVPAEKVSQSLW